MLGREQTLLKRLSICLLLRIKSISNGAYYWLLQFYFLFHFDYSVGSRSFYLHRMCYHLHSNHQDICTQNYHQYLYMWSCLPYMVSSSIHRFLLNSEVSYYCINVFRYAINGTYAWIILLSF